MVEEIVIANIKVQSWNPLRNTHIKEEGKVFCGTVAGNLIS
jgi:hypothetical protein